MIRERVKLVCGSGKSPFFSHLVMSMPLREDFGQETMATDGMYIYYNPDFVVKRTPDDLQFILVHEAVHPALGHLWRQGNRNHEKWNRATDYADNQILYKNGYKLPADALYNPAFLNMSAEQIYAKLPDEPGDGEDTIDSHDKWDDLKDGKGKGDPGDSGSSKLPTDIEQIWKERLARAVNACGQGKLPSNIESIVADVLEPKLPWRELLRNFIQSSHKSNYKLTPPSKRFMHIPMYLPSCDGEFLEIAVARDTSGSISNPVLEAFVSEMRGITDQFEDYLVHLYVCDAKIQDYWEVGPFEEWPTSCRGRGGTDFRPVFEDIAEKGINPSCLVYLTDSYGTFPDIEPDYPVLWVVTTPDAKVPFGDQIFLDLNEKG